MMNARLMITFLLLYLMLPGCEYVDRLTHDGIMVRKNLKTGKLLHIIADAPCLMVLHNALDTTYIKGLDHLIRDLELAEDNGTLIIKHGNKNALQKYEPIELHLPFAQIQKITANTALELYTSDTIKTDRFTLIMNGEAKFSDVSLVLDCRQLTLNVYGNNNIGNYLLEGHCQGSYFTLEGAVNIDAANLESNTSVVHHKSIGRCHVFVNDKLNVSTYSSGNTYYKGTATVQHNRVPVSYLPNTGRLIKID